MSQSTVQRAMASSALATLSPFERLTEQAQQHPGKTGYRLFAHGGEAFALRVATAEQARQTLDIQTYIFEDGHSTRRLISRLIEAAERGVGIRLLIDDLTVGGLQRRLAMLDAHPRIEIRIFNPVRYGRRIAPLRWLIFALQAHRLHRRMHNKLWLADDTVAVVGGRNLSDDYFSVNPAHDFLDIDVAAVGGPAIAELKQAFEAYWSHGLAVPLRSLQRCSPDAWRSLYTLCQPRAPQAHYTRALDAVCTCPLETLLTPLSWSTSEVVWDNPEVLAVAGRPPATMRMSRAVGAALATVQQRLLAISGYFVPEQLDDIDLLAMARRGVKVTVLTNALEASDVPLVHGAYAPHRPALLSAGVRLHEVRRRQRIRHERLRRRRRTFSRPRLSPSQAYSLHAKALALDGQRLIIGSFNLDPRSVWWNSEIAIIIESAALNRQLTLIGEWGRQPRFSFRVRCDGKQLRWHYVDHDGRARHLTREPGTIWRRFQAWCSRHLGLAGYL